MIDLCKCLSYKSPFFDWFARVHSMSRSKYFWGLNWVRRLGAQTLIFQEERIKAHEWLDTFDKSLCVRVFIFAAKESCLSLVVSLGI